ncbi:hypothetical protein QFZ73_005023 [Peribacillus sp. V2I11]|nr:hypothetical protein [Peribacillus sp. V2I11]
MKMGASKDLSGTSMAKMHDEFLTIPIMLYKQENLKE